MPWIKQGAGRLVPTPTWQPFPPFPKTLRLLPPGERIADVGVARARCAREGVEQVRAGAHLWPASVVNIVLVHNVRSWFSGRRAPRLAELAASLLPAPHKDLDRFLIRCASAPDLAAGVYFVGRKPHD